MNQPGFSGSQAKRRWGNFPDWTKFVSGIGEILMSPDIIILVGAAIGCGLMFAATFTTKL
jgi:hypothetical protein